MPLRVAIQNALMRERAQRCWAWIHRTGNGLLAVPLVLASGTIERRHDTRVRGETNDANDILFATVWTRLSLTDKISTMVSSVYMIDDLGLESELFIRSACEQLD